MSLIPRQATYGLTTVTCDASHQNLDNSLGQNPCLVYAWMVGSCASIVVQVDPLSTSPTYPAPVNDTSQGILSASKCTCERISYNLASACSVCQNKTEILKWDDWSANCGNFTGQYDYSKNIPAGTKLPVWSTGQTDAEKFDWNVAVAAGNSDLSPSSQTTTSHPTISRSVAPRPTNPNPAANAAINTVPITASITLAAISTALFCFVVVAFMLLRRGVIPDKKSSSSSLLHPILLSIILLLAVILSSASTWTSAVISAGQKWGGSGNQRSTLNFMVFTSWWTLLTGIYFLLAFQWDLRNKQNEMQRVRLAPLQAHFIWLTSTWIFWVILSSLFVANMNGKENCESICGVLRAITVFSFLELTVMSVLLLSVIVSFIRSARKTPQKMLQQAYVRERK